MPLKHFNASPTEAAAAAAVAPRVPSQATLICEALKRFGPLSRSELANLTGLLPQSICGRIVRLREKGFVVNDGTTINSRGYQETRYRLV